MKKSRKIIGLLVFMFCILFAGKVEAFAAVNNVDGMNIELKTNQSEYTGREEIEVTATVKNANDFTVEDLKLEAEVPDGYHMEDVSQQFEEVEGRESVQIEYLLIPDKGLFDFSNQKMMIALLFVILVLLLICSIILFVILKKRGKETLALFLCIVTVAGVLSPVGSMRVSAAENKIKSGEYTAKKEILVDGEKITFSVKATYKMPKDLDDDTEYTEGEWVTILADKMQKNIEEDAFLNEFADSEEIATREFAAYTAITVLGFEEETDLSCKDEEALEYSKADYLAVKQGLMFLEDDYFYPERALSTKEKNQIVAAINYFNDAFLIDPEDKTENVEYDEGVFVDEFKDVTDYTLEVNDKGKIIVKFDKNYLPKQFEEGSIFVLPKNDENPFGITLKAEKIRKDGDEVSLTCSYPKMEEVYSKLQFAGDCMLDENNITTAEGVESKYLPVMYADTSAAMEIEKDSVKFSLSKTIEFEEGIEAELSGTVTAKIPEIDTKMDIDFSKEGISVNEFAMQIAENMELEASVKVEAEDKTELYEKTYEIKEDSKDKTSEDEDKKEEKDNTDSSQPETKIELGELPFALGTTGLVFKVKVYALVSVSGEVSVGYTIDSLAGIQVVNDSVRWIYDFEKFEEEVKIEAKVEVGVEIAIALGWVVLEELHEFVEEIPEELIEIGFSTGLGFEGVFTIHLDVSPALYCGDVSSYIFFRVGLNEECLIAYAIEDVIDIDDFQIESKLGEEIHFENGAKVEQCSYESDDKSENHDVIDNDIYQKLQNGDFSMFAGTYTATLEDNDGYGGGEKLDDLVLNTDGTIMGGGSHFSKELYPKSKPTEVIQNEDGSYSCILTEECYYVIYPVGIIQNYQYILENQAYLKDTVYIECIRGTLNITYYSRDNVLATLEYDGMDWVSQEDFKQEVGTTFVSGTGITYTVISKEENFDAGRERVVLMSDHGEKRMVSNMPAFQVDHRTGMIYFDIYEYSISPHYVKYE